MTGAPVVVVGAGPVGQTAALLLARWGVPSVVLDRRPARDPVGSKAICQHRDVLDVWEAVGAGARIAAEGVTWTTARTFHRGVELFARTLPDPGRSPFPPFVNISQARTEEILDERIAATPLVDVRWGHEVVALEQDGGGVTVRCAGGAVLRAPYVLCCAGARADGLRAGLGVGFPGRSFDDRFLICDVRADLPGRARERHFHFDPAWNPGRQVLVHPCPDSTFRIDWQVPSGFDLAAETESGALDRRIRQVTGERPYELVWSSVYRFSSRVAERFRCGRVLLAGDAAHLFSPFGARGLNSGVADAENAAWKLAWVLAGRAPEALLESYHAERHAAAVENLAVTGATMDFLVPQDAAAAAHRRDVLERAGRDPDARAFVDSGRLYEPHAYAGSPLTTSGAGELVPDGPVSAQGCQGDPAHSRLRTTTRDGFLLLTVGDVAPDAVAGHGVPVLDLDAADVEGVLVPALGARPGQVRVLRPDAHVAAVLDRPGRAEVAAALRRATGYTGPVGSTGQEEARDGVLPTVR